MSALTTARTALPTIRRHTISSGVLQALSLFVIEFEFVAWGQAEIRSRKTNGHFEKHVASFSYGGLAETSPRS